MPEQKWSQYSSFEFQERLLKSLMFFVFLVVVLFKLLGPELLSFQRPHPESQGHEFNAVNDLGRLDVETDARILPHPHPKWVQNTLAGWMRIGSRKTLGRSEVGGWGI